MLLTLLEQYPGFQLQKEVGHNVALKKKISFVMSRLSVNSALDHFITMSKYSS